jgi:DNA-binding CsgD family transcriptional regulator
MDRRRSSRIIPEIYEATVNPAHWDYVLEIVARQTGSKSAFLYYQDKELGIANTVAQFGCPEDMIQVYSNQFAKLDALFDKASIGDQGEENLCQLFSPSSENFGDAGSDAYNNWAKLQGIYHVGRVQFLDDQSHKAAIAILRDEDAGPWRKGDIRFINEIVPHFERALSIHAEFTRLRLKQDALLKGLDRLVVGLILFDRDANEVYINPTAQSIIESHPALTMVDGHLVLNDANQNRILRQTIIDTALVDPDDSWKQSVAIGVNHPDIPAPLPLLITPMHADLVTSDLDYEGAKVAMFLSDPNLEQPISIGNLVSVYNLTPSEAQVAISMANGHSIEIIANTTHHSTHTIRSQLKAVFKKMGVTKQSELLKLLLTGPFAQRRRSKNV